MPTRDARDSSEATLPPPEELERESTKLNTAVKALIALALAKQLASPSVPQGPDVDVLGKAAVVTALVFLMASRKYNVDLDVVYGPVGRAAHTQTLADTASKWSRDHSSTLGFLVPTVKKRRAWEEAAAQSLTTSVMSQMLSDIADEMNTNVRPGRRVKKVWMTRGDHRVRHSHVRLHGSSHHLRTPFRAWPVTGQKMMYPGDKSAPLSETINCRCFMWLTRGTAQQIQQSVVENRPMPAVLASLGALESSIDELFPMNSGARVFYTERLKERAGITEQQ